MTNQTCVEDGASPLLLDRLRAVVGRRHVLTARADTAVYITGYRGGPGVAVAVVRPGTLVEQWRVFKACVAADHVVIVQAANTGLTGGSTPHGDYDRPVVVINTLRIRGIFPVRNGAQVICLAGATLHDLEGSLAPLDREPHSVIGSSCLGASVVGGICNNSGGALISRGPAFTHYALFARVDEAGEVRLHNHLGLDLGGGSDGGLALGLDPENDPDGSPHDDPETLLAALEAGRFRDDRPLPDDRLASAQDYDAIVRAVDAPSPARYNNDPARLHEASGSAGKLMVFAVRLDSFPRQARTTTFYIGTNDTAELTALRRTMLTGCETLPISAEYIHRDAFDITATYGKDSVLLIHGFGTQRLPRLFALKARMEAIARRIPFLPPAVIDRLLQAGSRLFPQHLPPRMRDFRDRYEHHLILKVAQPGVAEARAMLASLWPSPSGAMFECDDHEAKRAFLHRFAVAGAAVRYRAIHGDRVEDMVALDIALRRNDDEWFETLPPEIDRQVAARLYYGHFFCHVLHQDYLLHKGTDPALFKAQMLALLDRRGAEYPAEHNVGHLYAARPALAAHYRALDPCNQMNPGIGKTSRKRHWH
ncbi:D-lactate dehydrogenase [Sphingobium sufflavum]|uniref:D-lactate dehydrogenase n=1 Tax=Sphingobium sufflavum TaxID=1129547 RepID=UPI001F2F7FA4|nr:D-lactate dehydrogenase [Sphingobium sufflavum]MCE7797074.1 D-lactate dehydrogenase [Sphingobium sufflavum]